MEKSSTSYHDKKAEKLLSNALLMLREALKKNSDIFIMGDLPLFGKKRGKQIEAIGNESIIGTSLMKKSATAPTSSPDDPMKQALKEAVKQLKPKIRSHIKTLLKDERRIIKKLKMGGSEFMVSFAHLGSEERESFVEGGIIFINRDHPVFKLLENKTELAYYHLIRLVSQELIKFAQPRTVDIAFDWQAKLIKDAYRGGKQE